MITLTKIKDIKLPSSVPINICNKNKNNKNSNHNTDKEVENKYGFQCFSFNNKIFASPSPPNKWNERLLKRLYE